MDAKLRKYKKRKIRVRAKMTGTKSRPRLSVHKSNKYIYAQIINDEEGKTIASAKGTKPAEVGSALAKKAVAKKVKAIVFDRGGFKYHGKIKALAEAAREGGLDF
jgi:large subunit ribosomal protein L18